MRPKRIKDYHMTAYPWLLSLLALLTFTACLEDEVISPTSGDRLISLTTDRGNERWRQQFFYSSTGEVRRVFSPDPFQRNFELIYTSGQVSELLTFNTENDSMPIFRDLLTYDTDGKLIEFSKFDFDEAGMERPRLRNEFEYDAAGRVGKKTTLLQEDIHSIDLYHWEGGNIEKVEAFDESGERLRQEIFYQYDNKRNYRQFLPIELNNPVAWGRNNVVHSQVTDYTGLYDPICNPCRTTYQYNLDGWPVVIDHQWNTTLILTYD